MKIIAFISILFVFVMVSAPCGDAIDIDEPSIENVGAKNNVDAKSLDYKADKHQETYPSVCLCQCCPSIYGNPIDFPKFTLTPPSMIIPGEKENFSSVFPVFIWSPPQLVS